MLLPTIRLKAQRAAVVVANVSTPGIDTLLFNAVSTDLGYDVRWLTPDSVVNYNSTYFDTAFDVVIWCGNEVSGPYPSAAADTVANAAVGFVSLLPENWDEINLGVNSAGTNGRTAENAGYVLAIDRDHWITRVLQDTVYLWAATSVQIFGLVFPDTAHDIRPLIIDKDNLSDTAKVHLCAADSGDTIINTGDGNNVAKGRRVFLGLFSVTSTPRDSCQLYTIFERCIAWAAGDTLNEHISQSACFSGRIEVEDAWSENSSGADSLESYGAWPSLYTGFDFDPKVTFMKIANDALRRKVPDGSAQVDDFAIRMRVNSVANDPADSLWESTNGIRLIKRHWVCGDATGSVSTNYVSWHFRYLQPPDSFTWAQGGAMALNIDVVDTALDSIQQNRDNTYPNAFLNWSIPPEFAQRMIADTLDNHGWVWHNFWNNQVGGLNDAEIIYYSSDAGVVNDKPLITIRWSPAAVTQASRRRYPVIGRGLMEE